MQGTQYATKRSILCRGAFCGPTVRIGNSRICLLSDICRHMQTTFSEGYTLYIDINILKTSLTNHYLFCKMRFK